MPIAATRISTVVVPSASYALVDLATVKDELSIPLSDTTKDATLTRMIAYVSAIVSNYCNPPFAPFSVESLLDVFNFTADPFSAGTFAGDSRIALERFPVLQIASAVQTLPNGTTQALVAGTDYLLNNAVGELTRLDANGRSTRWETYPLAIAYTAGYGTLTTGEAHSVPASGPYTVTVANAATFAFDAGVTYANGTALTAVTGTPARGQYTVNGTTGTYTFAAADAGAAILLTYTWNSMPADLISHTVELLTMRWRARGRDPMLMQQETPGVGINRYWVGQMPGQQSEVPPHIAASLDNYRRPRIA